MKNWSDTATARGFGRTLILVRFLLGLIFAAGLTVVGQTAENFESPVPVLLTEANSPYVIAANVDAWRGESRKATTDAFAPGHRIVVFVSNLDLLAGEDANAFRVFGENKEGKRFRFLAESMTRLPRQNGVYGLIFRIVDPNGYNGQPEPDAEIRLTIAWRGNISNGGILALGPRDPAKRATAFKNLEAPRPNAADSTQINTADRKRFMEQAAFGPSRALDNKLRRVGFRAWINEQFVTPYPTIPYPNFSIRSFDPPLGCPTYGSSPEADLCHRNHYWDYNNKKWMMLEALYGEDQLRRRVSWALHQIWVVAHGNISQQRGMQEYIEILDRHSFGNYRDLMYEMTLSPAMGEYLDMVRSTRQNPNENYPRELLQLFTVGLYMLNQDGSLILDGQGNRIATYDQEKINQFTKVFTGWTHCNNGLNSECPGAVPAIPNYIDPMHLATPANHDTTAKSLFNYAGAPNQTIAACTNCATDAARRTYAIDSLNKTLDNIFYHPNIGPYIGKVLIQHLVTSDPSPAYVSRVAAAFNNNGGGVRGDMKAVIRAILLDPEARGSQKTDPTYGKLREPIQYMTNILRSFDVRAGTNGSPNGAPATPPASCQGRSDGVFDWVMYNMGQNVYYPPSVFNYFPPDYAVPGTDIIGPEFALANTSSSFARINHVFDFAFGTIWIGIPTAADPYPWTPCGTSIDRSEAVSWVTADPSLNTLIEGLNMRMMHGTMSPAMKNIIRTSIATHGDAQAKAAQAIYLIASSSQYQIQR